MSTNVNDFPIVEDPSEKWISGKTTEGLYGNEAMQRALCIDFDGVLNSYESGWMGHDNIPDPPMPGAVKECHALADAGWKLYVLSSRVHLEPVAEWLAKWNFPPMILTRIKPIAVAYIDDRAHRFTNWTDVRKTYS
ncbi:MAG: hypothetical protein QQN63_08165 [Nitrosopumilus sp.]